MSTDIDYSGRVAIILNANAKRVTPKVKARLERLEHRADLFYSRSMEDANQILRTVLERGYSTLLSGGGDGTIVQTMSGLFANTGRISSEASFKRDHRWLQPVASGFRPLPALGILKLGTGNALAGVVGAGHFVKDAERVCAMLEEGREPTRLSIPLMEAEDRVFPFGGLGWDALILNDYNRLKLNTEKSLFRTLTHSVLGYLIAGVGMTAPVMAVKRPPEVELRTLGEATLIGPNGGVARRFERGDVLYRGPINLLSFSTVPYYGFGFELFPFTHGISDRFQVRLSTMSVAEVLAHLPAIWKGKYRSPGLLDFHCERVTLSFSRKVPYQTGGDARGERETLTISAASTQIDLIDYRTSLQLASQAALEQPLPQPLRNASLS